MKRTLAESDSEDGFDEKEGSPAQHGGGVTRKKRRGVIEKRRRDRINQSLTELRRLVPTAFEKQGSAKLEKAEILQMAVDHLKLLHSKGLNSYNIDPATLAMDYRSVGFRECAAEVARYLVTVEGMDIQNPLRLRLMSHLQCYNAQRDAAAKSGAAQAGWPVSSQHSATAQPDYYATSPPLHHHASAHHAASGLHPCGTPPSAGQFAGPPHHPHGIPLNPMLSPSQGFSSRNPLPSGDSGIDIKPYRPWGGELVY